MMEKNRSVAVKLMIPDFVPKFYVNENIASMDLVPMYYYDYGNNYDGERPGQPWR